LIFLTFLLPPSLFSVPLSLSCLSSSPSLLFTKPNLFSSSPSLPSPKQNPISRRLPHSLSRASNPPIHQRSRTNKDAERRTTPPSTTPPSGLMLEANNRYDY
ncbi:hypothetical protein Tsubulata_020112, partial [Turnera subulata]